jgi:dipeptidyl-peptidase 4
VIVLAIPLVNPDGGEVRRRTNEAGYDMNRDYVKLESQEIHALVTQVMNEWTPDIHVDGHHGGSAPYVITYQGTLNPAADAELRAYPYEHIFPRIREAVRRPRTTPRSTTRASDPRRRARLGLDVRRARKHHVYTGLTNSIGILLETPSNTHRVMRDGTSSRSPRRSATSTRSAAACCDERDHLRAAAEQRTAIRALTTASRMRAIEAGLDRWRPDRARLRAASRAAPSRSGCRTPDARRATRSTTCPCTCAGSRRARRRAPVGYLLPPSMAAVVPLLQDHDIACTGSASRRRSTPRCTTPRGEPRRVLPGPLPEVRRGREGERDARGRAGLVLDSHRAVAANLISYILEPETDDNLITWGWTDHVLEVTEEGDDERQRVPMMRVMTHQHTPAVHVQPFNLYQRNRYFRPGY